jgi:hypothetical protein
MISKLRIAIFTAAFTLCSLTLLAQDQTITPSASDDLAASQFTQTFASANRALTDAGLAAPASDLRVTNASRNGGSKGDGRHPFLFPADLSKFDPNAPVVPNATLHNIFINQPPAAWGNPVGFLNDLNRSDLIHITDQYVGVNFDGRYPVGASFLANVTPGAAFPGLPANIITQGQIISLVHAAGSITGTGNGYDHMFNVFIPPGTDTCFPGNRACFSPDNGRTFAFCAYHFSGTFSDIGHVIITVLPETGVPGCASQQPSINGIVADSVDSTASHEIIEAITDPDGNAFFVLGSLDLGGAEIGDVCQPGGNDAAEFLVPTFRVGRHLYAIQLEYSNLGHGCFAHPGGA